MARQRGQRGERSRSRHARYAQGGLSLHGGMALVSGVLARASTRRALAWPDLSRLLAALCSVASASTAVWLALSRSEGSALVAGILATVIAPLGLGLGVLLLRQGIHALIRVLWFSVFAVVCSGFLLPFAPIGFSLVAVFASVSGALLCQSGSGRTAQRHSAASGGWEDGHVRRG